MAVGRYLQSLYLLDNWARGSVEAESVRWRVGILLPIRVARTSDKSLQGGGASPIRTQHYTSTIKWICPPAEATHRCSAHPTPFRYSPKRANAAIAVSARRVARDVVRRLNLLLSSATESSRDVRYVKR